MDEQSIHELASRLGDEGEALPERRRRRWMSRPSTPTPESRQEDSVPSDQGDARPTKPLPPGTVIAMMELYDRLIPIGPDGRPVLGAIDEGWESTPTLEDVLDIQQG